MKHKTIATLVAIATTGMASAASSVMTFSTYVANDASDTSWVITTLGVGSANFGGVDVTYGGVDWVGNQSNGHIPTQTYVDVNGFFIYHSLPGTGWANNASGYYPDDTSNGLLNDGTFISDGTIDINGLVSGQQYMATFLFANGTAGATGSTVNVTASGGYTGSSGDTQFAFGDAKFLVVTATWTADGFGDSFIPQVNGGSGSSLNAVQVVAVPEPSAMLLGALGGFALLRRRRI